MLCNRRKVFHAFLCLGAQRKGMVIKMKKSALNYFVKICEDIEKDGLKKNEKGNSLY